MRAGSLLGVFMATKPFTTIAGQISLLQGRGMQLDPDQAAMWLSNVGYYRLSGYWYVYREINSSGSPTNMFSTGTAFTDITSLYEFDRKLRTLLHDAIERIEVGLRSHLSYHLGRIDPLAHEDAANFRPGFDHASWLSVARRRISRARSHSEPIRHHLANYRGSVPIWVLTDVLDFADLSKLYEGMNSRDQWAVAESLGIHIDLTPLSKNQSSKAKKSHPLVRWFEHLSILRNSSAHHARMWNRSFTPAPTAALTTIPTLAALPTGQSERVYGALALIAYLLGTLAPHSTWNGKVKELVETSFEQIPCRDASELGFPTGWKTQDLWSLPCGNW